MVLFFDRAPAACVPLPHPSLNDHHYPRIQPGCAGVVDRPQPWRPWDSLATTIGPIQPHARAARALPWSRILLVLLPSTHHWQVSPRHRCPPLARPCPSHRHLGQPGYPRSPALPTTRATSSGLHLRRPHSVGYAHYLHGLQPQQTAPTNSSVPTSTARCHPRHRYHHYRHHHHRLVTPNAPAATMIVIRPLQTATLTVTSTVTSTVTVIAIATDRTTRQHWNSSPMHASAQNLSEMRAKAFSTASGQRNATVTYETTLPMPQSRTCGSCSESPPTPAAIAPRPAPLRGYPPTHSTQTARPPDSWHSPTGAGSLPQTTSTNAVTTMPTPSAPPASHSQCRRRQPQPTWRPDPHCHSGKPIAHCPRYHRRTPWCACANACAGARPGISRRAPLQLRPSSGG